MSNQILFTKSAIASIFEESLSDGSKVYNVRIYDSRENYDITKFVEFIANDEKHALKVFETLNSLS